ncbi:beta-Keto acyl carrier protein reductase [Proteiniphilum saccharofermentans]|jgi:3-oxoacyl-[acyl-carrier protein] reductase|uniref:Beta-Keto acyl carrier protein reductase n=1 Tax=Proteiniphilum saccharofermentans TaxID=1642647 RepID=A0A1R3SWQ8_9BACT|nr:SDR family oxidoreductase [Proteiniphilum saccharofermentans]SCD19400.1 beta-Keto acyl carrier protein reductase [Proteiniphilum saccharofermentans]
MGQIVITGASSAIGWAIAEELSTIGKPMLLQGTRKHELPLNELSANAEFVMADFSSPAALEHFISRLTDVDILVNAAACTITELLPQTRDESIDKMIAVNIAALVKICKAIIPPMCAKRSGVIVNITSVAASKVYRGQSVYAGTKAFSEAFSKGIAAEYGRKGVRCNCVAPGCINSGTLKLLAHIAKDKINQSNAMAKMGEPRDVAAAVAFLCREENAFINGTVLHVDGGQWIGL